MICGEEEIFPSSLTIGADNPQKEVGQALELEPMVDPEWGTGGPDPPVILTKIRSSRYEQFLLFTRKNQGLFGKGLKPKIQRYKMTSGYW